MMPDDAQRRRTAQHTATYAHESPLVQFVDQLVLAQATELARRGRYAEAEVLLAKGMNGQRLRAATFDLRARMAAQQHAWEDAHTFWVSAQQLDPDNAVYQAALQAVATHRHRAQATPPAEGAEQAAPVSEGDQLAQIFLVALADAQPDLTICPAIAFNVAPSDEPAFIMTPDIAFVRSDRIPADMAPDGPWPLVPDVVLEIAPPQAAPDEMQALARTWLMYGTRLVWLMWPDAASIEVWHPEHDTAMQVLGLGDTLDGGDVITHLALPLAMIFPDQTPTAVA